MFARIRLLAICCVFCLAAISGVNAEEKDSINVKLIEKPLSELFKQIETESAYRFVYDNTVNVSKNVTVQLSNSTVEDVLSSTLGKLGLNYKIIDNQIVITQEKSVVEKKPQVVNNKVKFLIKTLLGEPIAGATIIIKGTTTGDITVADGSAYVVAKSGNVIEISYIGYKPASIVLGDESLVEVTMEEDALLVEDVVVVGFGTQKKVNLTGAVSSVKMDDVLGERPISNVKSALQGVIPGLQITSTNGRPGSDMNINIRGTNSINGGSPLVLVDNIPMDINMVNPSDIESVNVLKDAAASAIYGARAAFGVVLITTKQGSKDDKMQLNYSGNFSFSTATDLPRVASPLDAIKALASSGQAADASLGCNLEKWMGYINDYNVNPANYPSGYVIDDLGTKYYLKENDHVRNMMDRFGFQHMHNLSLSGSTSKTSYRVSLGVVDEDGILYSKKDSYKRYNLSSYISAKPLDWLDISADIKYADSERTLVTQGVRGGVWGNAMNTPSYMPIDSQVINGKEYLAETSKTAIILGSENPTTNSNLRTIGRAVITPTKGLSLTAEYGFTRDAIQTRTYDKLFIYGTPVGETKPSVPNSKYKIDQTNGLLHSLNVFANYTKEWKNHTFSAMVGYNQEDSDTKGYWLSKKDIINDELPSISQATGDMDMSDSYLQYSTRSLFYRLNYNYKERYLLEVNGRYDGSSKFPKNSRFGFFPSASVAWRLSEEKFMEWSSSYLNNFKLRASYGSIGNQAINPYAFIPTMNANYASWLHENALVTTLATPGIVSSTFTWESVNTINLGVDLGMFRNRLSATFNYYIRDTKNMLTAGMELPSTLGTAAPRDNAADLRTKGYEFEVNWQDQVGAVHYNVGFNIYNSKSEITRFNNSIGLLSSNRVGMELGEIWGFVTDRFYTTDDFDASGKLNKDIAVVKGVTPQPGDILYKDFDGNGIIDNGVNTLSNPGDMQIIGNNSRRLQYGISGGVGFKGLEFSFLIQGVGKRDMWLNNTLIFPQYAEFNTTFSHQLDYWTPENTDAFYPRIYERSQGNTDANRKVQTKYMINGAYCRIKNLTLSYSLPKRWVQHLSLQRASVSFSGEDLLTFKSAPNGIDPEITGSQSGWDYPYMRRFSIGINLTF